MELFTETSWLAVMVGQGIEAGGYHPAADILPDGETLERLAHIRDVIAKTAQMMPTPGRVPAADWRAQRHRPAPRVLMSLPPPQPIKEYARVNRALLDEEIRPSRQPAVLRGVAADWPAVRAARDRMRRLSTM